MVRELSFRLYIASNFKNKLFLFDDKLLSSLELLHLSCEMTLSNFFFLFEHEIIHALFELQVSTAESVKMLTYSRLEVVFKDVSEGIHDVMCAQATVVRFDDILSGKPVTYLLISGIFLAGGPWLAQLQLARSRV